MWDVDGGRERKVTGYVVSYTGDGYFIMQPLHLESGRTTFSTMCFSLLFPSFCSAAVSSRSCHACRSHMSLLMLA